VPPLARLDQHHADSGSNDREGKAREARAGSEIGDLAGRRQVTLQRQGVEDQPMDDRRDAEVRGQVQAGGPGREERRQRQELVPLTLVELEPERLEALGEERRGIGLGSAQGVPRGTRQWIDRIARTRSGGTAGRDTPRSRWCSTWNFPFRLRAWLPRSAEAPLRTPRPPRERRLPAGSGLLPRSSWPSHGARGRSGE